MAIPRSLSDGGDNKTGTSTAYPGSGAGFLHGQTCYPQSQYFNTTMRNILEIKQKSLVGMSDDEIKAYLEELGFGWRDWYFNRVPMPSNIIENLAFWKKTSVYVDNVSLEDVIGHNHGSVSSDLNWITLLSSLNRHKYDCDTQSILKMLREQDQIPDSSDSLILLNKYGSCYFFSLGRHRVVQAKFLELDSIHCAVWE